MRTTPMTPDLYNYVLKYNPYPHPVLPKVAAETMKRTDSRMQISQDQGAFLHMLVKLMGAKRGIEVGCFTGYSAIAMASALPKDGKLITLDVNKETAQMAESFFREAGLDKKVSLRLGPAQETLAKLEQEFGKESFDWMFVDADKSNYAQYYEAGMRLIRPGGLIIVDNVIWSGRVLDASDQSEDTKAIRRFNEMTERDERVEKVMLHISDGLLLLRKKSLFD